MGVPFKPNTVVVKPKVLTKDINGVVLTDGFGSPQTITCLAHPENAGSVLRDTGLSLERPYSLFVELADRAAFPAGSEITAITGPGGVMEAGPLYVQATEAFSHGIASDHLYVLAGNEMQ